MVDPILVNAGVKNDEAATAVENIKYIHSYSLPVETQPEEKPKEVAEVKPVEKPSLRQVQSGRVTKRQRKPNKKFDDSSDDDSDAEFEVKKSKAGRKVKLYQMPEFKNDPAMEQKRQNAINAKVNRDRKKKEKNALQSQMQILRNENKSLQKKNRKYHSRISSLEQRLEIMEALITSHGLNSALKASDPEE